ncbi:MAG: porin, partial [Rhodocyclaceae bacterium]|nr:porin [Rhodocyclaceae bacterium]
MEALPPLSQIQGEISMQKKLIALAIAGLSSTAFAQSNVTISGVIKGGYDSTKISGGTAATGSMNQFSDQASNFALSGSEALGNGLSAIFRIETRFGIDGFDNASNVGTGNTHVGLKSATFGEIKLGTQDLHYNEIERIENGAKSLSQQAMVGRSILSQVGGNFIGAGTVRTKNVMFWDSPNWSGFTARV